MFTTELIYDIALGAFYKNEIKELASDTPYVTDYVLSPAYTTITTEETITTNAGVDVTNAALVDVSTNIVTVDRDDVRLKYLAYQDPYITVSLYRNTNFIDWISSDLSGLDANAYMLTGYEILGAADKHQQSPYVICHFRRTEETYSLVDSVVVLDNESSCKMQAQWAFADSATSNKFGPEQQVYRLLRPYTPTSPPTYDYGFDVITTRNKVRGRGRALSLLFKTEAGKDLKMHGWEVKFTENQNV